MAFNIQSTVVGNIAGGGYTFDGSSAGGRRMYEVLCWAYTGDSTYTSKIYFRNECGGITGYAYESSFMTYNIS